MAASFGRRAGVLVAALSMLAGGVSALGAPASGPILAPSGAEALRTAAASGRLSEVLAGLDRFTPRASWSASSGAVALPPAIETALASALPPALAGPTIDLARATMQADAVVRSAIDPAARPLVRQALADLYTRRLQAVRPGPDGQPQVAPELAQLAGAVDLRSMLDAAGHIATAVDALRRAAPAVPAQWPAGSAARATTPAGANDGAATAGPGSAPASRSAVEGGAAAACDVVDAAPLVCVSGTGVQTHAGTYWLDVDLGGADRYVSATAAGTCVDDEDPTGAPCVAVSVDLGGDDVYAPGATLHRCLIPIAGGVTMTCGSGSGQGGLGLLVDVSGNDRYETVIGTSPDPGCFGGNFTICGVAVSQGSGQFGVGILADLAGDDVYSVVGPRSAGSQPDKSLTIWTQASSTLGVGLIWDDAGNDRYTVSGPATGYFDEEGSLHAWTSYEVQGAATGGPGILLDSGGDDRFLVEARPGDGAEARTSHGALGQGLAAGGNFINGGQGIGFGVSGAPTLGAIIAGRGRSEYVLDMQGRSSAWSSGQGFGSAGLIDDAGGDDTYRLHATVDTTVRDVCACSDAVAGFDPRTFSGFSLGVSEVNGQGAYQARVVERGGDDVYAATPRLHLGAVADAGPGGSAVAEVVGAGRVFAAAQGAGGELVDLVGDDAYRLTSEATYTAEARGGGMAATADPGPSSLFGQGQGGRLTDLGGRDEYRIDVRQHATAIPFDPRTTTDGGISALGQGMGSNSSFVDADAGEPDTFYLSSPGVFGVCDGAHGTAPGWTGGTFRTLTATGSESCARGDNRATVSSAAARLAPARLVDGTASTVGTDQVAFTWRLVDSAGAPLPGQRVRVAAEWRYGYPYYGIGPYTHWSPTAVARELTTDAAGRVSGVLPRLACTTDGGCEGDRLRAWYFGDPTGPQPATAALPFPPGV